MTRHADTGLPVLILPASEMERLEFVAKAASMGGGHIIITVPPSAEIIEIALDRLVDNRESE